MMNQLRNLTEPNAIKWGWSHGPGERPGERNASMTKSSGS